MFFHKSYTDLQGNIDTQIVFVDAENTVWIVPVDPANTDYQRYLEWVAEGNTPEPWQPNEPQEVV